MLTTEEARARVAKGAAHLDTVRPGWIDRLDVGRLTLHCGGFCVLGQLFMDFWIGVDSLYGIKPAQIDDAFGGWQLNDLPASHGFVMPRCELASYDLETDDYDYEPDYRPLQDAWIEEICNRRMLAEKQWVRAVEVMATSEPLSEPVGA